MFKRVLTTAVLGASALAMMAANATTNGAYVTGALGYARTGNSFKALPDTGATISKDKKAAKGSITGRVAIGYQFTPHWAAELGYLQLGKQKSNFSIPEYSSSLIQGSPVVMGTVTQSMTISQHAFDVVGKGIYPLSDKFNVYAKAGVAYLITNVSGNTIKGDDGKSVSLISPIAKHNWAPEAGLGFTYDITQNVFIDTSFTHIQPIGKNKPANIDFATVGIGYSFG